MINMCDDAKIPDILHYKLLVVFCFAFPGCFTGAGKGKDLRAKMGAKGDF